MKVAVVGSDDFVMGFQLAGVEHIYPVKKEYDAVVGKILEDCDMGILIMEDACFQKLGQRTKDGLERMATPVLVTISEKGGEEDIRKQIKKSIGVDLWR